MPQQKKGQESLVEYCRRLSDFENIPDLVEIVSCPLTHDLESAREDLQLELIDFNGKCQFHALLLEIKFSKLGKLAQRMLVLYGFTFTSKYMFIELTNEHRQSSPQIPCD